MASAALQWMCIRKNNSFLLKGPVGSPYSFSKARVFYPTHVQIYSKDPSILIKLTTCLGAEQPAKPAHVPLQRPRAQAHCRRRGARSARSRRREGREEAEDGHCQEGRQPSAQEGSRYIRTRT